MRWNRVAMTAVAAIIGAGSAQAAGRYGSINAGALWIEDNDTVITGVTINQEADIGYVINAALGYKFDNNFRAEIEVGFANIDVDATFTLGAASVRPGANVDILTITVNGYYDLKTGTNFTPYAGAGIGVAHQNVNTAPVTVGAVTIPAASDTETDLTAFGEVGVAYGVTANTDVVGSYRYQWIDNGGDGFDDDVMHILRVGLRFGF